MMMYLLMMNLIMSTIFMSMIHPLSMGMILLIQTLIVSLITGNMNYNYWFSYILFLIMVGGMLILFMYMTSIASNEKFKFNTKYMIMMMVPFLTMFMPSIKLNINTINNETIKFNTDMLINMSMNKYINWPTNMIITFLMIYLLLTLVATVKITNFKSGPLRQMN